MINIGAQHGSVHLSGGMPHLEFLTDASVLSFAALVACHSKYETIINSLTRLHLKKGLA